MQLWFGGASASASTSTRLTFIKGHYKVPGVATFLSSSQFRLAIDYNYNTGGAAPVDVELGGGERGIFMVVHNHQFPMSMSFSRGSVVFFRISPALSLVLLRKSPALSVVDRSNSPALQPSPSAWPLVPNWSPGPSRPVGPGGPPGASGSGSGSGGATEVAATSRSSAIRFAASMSDFSNRLRFDHCSARRGHVGHI